MIMELPVSEIYRLEIKHIVPNPKAEFDLTRRDRIIEAMFRE